MSPARGRNVAASVRQRLLNLARERDEDFQLVLVHFAIERLLYRLSVSRHAGGFVLKGAMLFVVWEGTPTRVTRDIDLLGGSQLSLDELAKVIRNIVAIVRLGELNTRMKDFYDLWLLAQRYDFDGAVLCRAIGSTLRRRGTAAPFEPPIGLLPEFLTAARTTELWTAFLKRSGVKFGHGQSLAEVGAQVAAFVLPAVGKGFSKIWVRGGPWRRSK